MEALHIRYTEWSAPVAEGRALRLRTEVKKKAEDDRLLILLRRSRVVDVRRSIREVTAILDPPHEVVGRLQFERQRRAGDVLHHAGRPRGAVAVIEVLDARHDG